MKTLVFYSRQLLVFFMAIQILNMSLDSMQFTAITKSNEVGMFNELNTVVEYVAEIVLGHSNAFPEYNNSKNSSKDYPLQKQVDQKIFPFETYAVVQPTTTSLPDFFIPLTERYTSVFYKEINPPPPKI
jgi:hypothetical protein